MGHAFIDVKPSYASVTSGTGRSHKPGVSHTQVDSGLQGDGTAFFFQEEPSVFTLSVHAANNFPARKQKSDLDVALPDGTGDDDYLRLTNSAAQFLSHAGSCLCCLPAVRQALVSGPVSELWFLA